MASNTGRPCRNFLGCREPADRITGKKAVAVIIEDIEVAPVIFGLPEER
jgi:hypothetical protein